MLWVKEHTAFASLYSETALCEAYENLVAGLNSGTMKWLQKSNKASKQNCMTNALKKISPLVSIQEMQIDLLVGVKPLGHLHSRDSGIAPGH